MACTCDLNNNELFEAQAGADWVVMQQRKGLPIGRHLSAGYAELVALRREFLCEWPSAMSGFPTARYSDNFFVAVKTERTVSEREQTAADLSELLAVPVGFARAGLVAGCLEVRFEWSADCPVKAVLAYWTDTERQGESGDVQTSPERLDPRTPALLLGLLAGLASKVMQYTAPEVGGLPASIRRAVGFLRRRGYPSKWWLRAFSCELLRHGAPMSCLPKALKGAVLPVFKDNGETRPLA